MLNRLIAWFDALLPKSADRATPTEPDMDQEWSKVLEWAETNGLKNMASRYATADVIAKESATTLTVLLAAIGSSLAYAVKVFEPGVVGPLVSGSSLVCLYLTVLGFILVFKCMRIEPIPSVYQEPAALAQAGYTLDQMRKVELSNLQKRIDEATLRNGRVASWLNRVRLSALVSPLVFVLGALPPSLRVAPAPTPAALFLLPCNLVGAPGPSASPAAGTSTVGTAISCQAKP